MNRFVKAVVLAKKLGVSPRTMQHWCSHEKGLAFKRNGVWYVKLQKIAEKPGFDLISALMVEGERWVKAVDLAKRVGIHRTHMSHWCRTEKSLCARRIGKIWYIDISKAPEWATQLDGKSVT